MNLSVIWCNLVICRASFNSFLLATLKMKEIFECLLSCFHSTFRVLLLNLTNPEHIQRRICSGYTAVISESGSAVANYIVRPPSPPSSLLDRLYLYLTEMLPDTFYSIEVRSVLHNGTVSQPTILPSSPLVLAAPPSGYPLQVSTFPVL